MWIKDLWNFLNIQLLQIYQLLVFALFVDFVGVIRFQLVLV